MPVVKCWECGYEKHVEDVNEARRLARVHMGLTPHLMVFGYSDKEFEKKNEKTDMAIPVELPIYKIAGKYYFRDERLKEYRNICNPNDKKPLDSVLETPTAEDTKIVYGTSPEIKGSIKCKCDHNPCHLKIKGERKEFPYYQGEKVRVIMPDKERSLIWIPSEQKEAWVKNSSLLFKEEAQK